MNVSCFMRRVGVVIGMEEGGGSRPGYCNTIHPKYGPATVECLCVGSCWVVRRALSENTRGCTCNCKLSVPVGTSVLGFCWFCSKWGAVGGGRHSLAACTLHGCWLWCVVVFDQERCLIVSKDETAYLHGTWLPRYLHSSKWKLDFLLSTHAS